jgi:Mce-associated membrane protein
MKQNRRRPSSANPTSRPRRVAGGVRKPAPEDTSEVEDVEPEPEPEAGPEDAAPTGTVAEDAEPDPEPEQDPEPEPLSENPYDEPMAGLVGSSRTTRVLLGVIALLAVIALAGGIFLVIDDDEEPSTATDTGSSIAADDETPVRISGKEAQVAVAQAAQAAYTIVATSYQDYEAQVDEAAALMTPAFAEEYRQTATDVEDGIVAGKTEVQVSVVAQGVVRADRDQVQALVFLNMFTTKNGKEAVYTPYRVLVTVVNTDQGWLVSNLDTK